jgi:hypothetical protein
MTRLVKGYNMRFKTGVKNFFGENYRHSKSGTRYFQ